MTAQRTCREPNEARMAATLVSTVERANGRLQYSKPI